MALRQEIKLNLIPNGHPVVVNVNQNDVGNNRLVFYLYFNGEPYIWNRSVTDFYIQGTKPDGRKFRHIMSTVRSEYAYCWLNADMSDVAGDVYCNIEMIENEVNRTGSQAFILRVQKEAKV